MEKHELVKMLVDDFISMFPDSSRAERLELSMRLNMMDIADLQLLVSQLKKET
jgi:hypothetical protein